MQIEPGKLYRHYMGNYYVVIGEATYSETEERIVVYHPLQCPERLKACPKWQFFQQIGCSDNPDRQKTRFVPVTREEVLRDVER